MRYVDTISRNISAGTAVLPQSLRVAVPDMAAELRFWVEGPGSTWSGVEGGGVTGFRHRPREFCVLP